MDTYTEASDLAETMRASCLAARVTRLHRVIARAYEQALRPLGLTQPQLEILGTLLIMTGPVKPSRSGRRADARTVLHAATLRSWRRAAGWPPRDLADRADDGRRHHRVRHRHAGQRQGCLAGGPGQRGRLSRPRRASHPGLLARTPSGEASRAGGRQFLAGGAERCAHACRGRPEGQKRHSSAKHDRQRSWIASSRAGPARATCRLRIRSQAGSTLTLFDDNCTGFGKVYDVASASRMSSAAAKAGECTSPRARAPSHLEPPAASLEAMRLGHHLGAGNAGEASKDPPTASRRGRWKASLAGCPARSHRQRSTAGAQAVTAAARSVRVERLAAGRLLAMPYSRTGRGPAPKGSWPYPSAMVVLRQRRRTPTYRIDPTENSVHRPIATGKVRRQITIFSCLPMGKAQVVER